VREEDAERAIGMLDGERERAERVVRRRGSSPRTARYLAAKGFSDDAIAAAIADGHGERLG
jgi:SOS response regulatory protein OraA/RecX